MARILTDGFEMQDLVSWIPSGTVIGVASISTVQKRSGEASVWFNGNGHSLKKFITDTSEGYIRVGFYIDSFAAAYSFSLFWGNSVTDLGYILLDTATQTLKLYEGGIVVETGITVIALHTWYLLEVYVKIDNAGTIDVKLDGVSEMATYSGDTQPGADTTFDYLYIANPPAGGNPRFYIDDAAVNDTSGGADNSWCNDGHIIARLAVGTVGSPELMGSDGNQVDNHLLVDEVPSDSDTTYVEGSVVDEQDIYDFAASGLATGSTINRIWAEARCRDTVADGGEIALITLAAGGAEVSGGDVILATTYTVRVMSAEQLVNPVDSAAWEIADVDAIQAGPRTRN